MVFIHNKSLKLLFYIAIAHLSKELNFCKEKVTQLFYLVKSHKSTTRCSEVGKLPPLVGELPGASMVGVRNLLEVLCG